jgi:hypothetical protein
MKIGPSALCMPVSSGCTALRRDVTDLGPPGSIFRRVRSFKKLGAFTCARVWTLRTSP